jgi:hypothetical protein
MLVRIGCESLAWRRQIGWELSNGEAGHDLFKVDVNAVAHGPSFITTDIAGT